MLSERHDIEDRPETDTGSACRVVICGEVSAGKSTVLNALLRARIVPDNIGRDTRPVIVARHRATPGAEVRYLDGQHRLSDAVDDPGLFQDAEQIQLWSDQQHLAGLELIEVPLTKAEDLTEAQIALIRSADVMIWVTIASQAWRLTELTIIEQLGDARPACGILAVTRADKLRNDDDRARLRDRIEREAGAYFNSCIFVNGARRQLDSAAASDAAWVRTGGAEIDEALKAFAESLKAEPVAAARPAGSGEVVDLAAFRVSPPPEQAAEPLPEPAPENLPAQGAEHLTEEPMPEAATPEQPVASLETPAPVAPVEVQPEAAEAGAMPATVAGLVPEVVPAADLAPAPEQSPDLVRDPSRVPAALRPPLRPVIPQEVSEGLRAALDTLPGVLVAGFVPYDRCADPQILSGEGAQGEILAAFCQCTLESLSAAFPTGAEPDAAITLSLSQHRFLFQEIAPRGRVFVLADASVMNHGLAQNALSRICRCLGVDPHS